MFGLMVILVSFYTYFFNKIDHNPRRVGGGTFIFIGLDTRSQYLFNACLKVEIG